MGYESPHGTGLRNITVQDSQVDNGEATKVTGGWESVVPNAGDSNEGGRF